MQSDLSAWDSRFDEITDDDVKAEAWVEPTEGWRHLMVEKAFYDKPSDQYRLTMRDLQTDALLNLTYFMTRANRQTGDPEMNTASAHTLRMLARAILNTDKGLPRPDAIIGGICRGYVKLKPVPRKDKQTGQAMYDEDGNPLMSRFPRIYEFKPASADWVADFSLLDDQFSVDTEEE